MKRALAIVATILLLLPAVGPTPVYGNGKGVSRGKGAGAGKGAAAAPAPTKPAIDPRADNLIKSMSDYLGSLEKFSVHVDTVRDAVLPSGMIVNGDRATELYVHRPNKLRANISSSARDVQVYYDGATVTVYTPKKCVYGSWPAPATLDDTIEVAAQKYGMAFPGADLLLSNPYSALMGNVTQGYYVGQTLIRGDLTHHLAFRQKDLDWQIWIDVGDNPLPRRFMIIDRSVRGSPRIASTLTDWNTSPSFTDELFTFVPPSGVQKINVLPVEKQPGQKQSPKPGG